jgi:DNA-nicking Smr family endonuclease
MAAPKDSLKDFAALKGLRDQLAEQERARLQAEAERARAERQAQQEANVFRGALDGVVVLPKSDRYVPNMPRAFSLQPQPKPLTAAEETAAVLRESLSDQFDVGHLLEDDPSTSFLRHGHGQDVLKKLRRGHWAVDDELDLHGLRRDQARDELGHFLRHARQRRFRCLCIIHGKGLGSAGGEPVLRGMVHSWLEQKPEVIAFCAAKVDERSHGALLVLLRSALREPDL